jgi:hypothetical protein
MKRCDGVDEATRHAWFEPGKEVDGQRPSPVLIRDGKKPRQSWAQRADVVDKDINAVKGLDGLGYQALRAVACCQIDLYGMHMRVIGEDVEFGAAL